MPLIPWFYAGLGELAASSLMAVWAGIGELSTPLGLNRART